MSWKKVNKHRILDGWKFFVVVGVEREKEKKERREK